MALKFSYLPLKSSQLAVLLMTYLQDLILVTTLAQNLILLFYVFRT